MACDPFALRTKITYIPTKLKDILISYQHRRDFRYKKLPIDAIKTIRSLRLNRKRRRHKYTAQKRLTKQHRQGSWPEKSHKNKKERVQRQHKHYNWDSKHSIHQKQGHTSKWINRWLQHRCINTNWDLAHKQWEWQTMARDDPTK